MLADATRRFVGLVMLVLACAACTVGVEPERPAAGPPSGEQVARALRFAALAPLPAGAAPVRLETQGGIDTQVVLTVRLDPAPWLAASGLRGDGGQQRVRNPDGALVYRSAVAGPGEVTVTAFTT
ncbi:hypothetical protein GCM10023200_51000 [Actinomycetospora chlora]|uniref:Uncharacterized protein n=1 Tax=Actinomycetospora chlora TaxID=663608 RepID=A0ABP9C9T2_9PSEU